MEESTNSQRKAIVTALAVLIIIVVIVAAVAASPKKKTETLTAAKTPTPTTSTQNTTPATTNTTTATNSTSNTTAPASTTASAYKDGSYSATGSYESPGGNEQITVNVTLKNDVVTATSAKSGAGDPEAQEYQSDFIGGYRSLVVGKDISKVSLSRVSGSSLTSQGFNDAISQIKNQAKA